MIAAAIYNAQRTKVTDTMFGWSDFFPDYKPAPAPQTEEQMLRAVEVWARRHRDTEAN